ncbi:MAG TPA: Lrp/AsnC family transcriptional regulator [Candidatus Nanoarchaeia archaeon]|nr:Lrp/AsnC family transcriptional regulator [Candidatus Nanoarchaeia archaeon]
MRHVPHIDPKDKVKLDLKDRKILSLLGENSRLPSTKISKVVSLSRDAVSHRIKMYENKGLIQGYKTVTDIRKFGYENYHIFIRLNKPSKENERKVVDSLSAHSFVRAILKFSGKYDLEIAVIAKSVSHLELIVETILFECSLYVLDYDILIVTGNYISRTFPKNFLGDDLRIISKVTLKTKNRNGYSADKKDFEILKILANNSRIQLYKIAEKVKMSPDSVNYRIKKMQEAGYISKFIPAINYSLLGRSVYAILLNTRILTKKEEDDLKKFFTHDLNVIWAVKTLGKYNLLFYLCTENQTDIHNTINNMRTLFPEKIKDYETLIAYEEYKYTYLPDVLFE